jgi:hypothetical protein
MASYCRFCGTPLSGPFCVRCGKAVSEGAPAQPAPQPSPQPSAPVPAKAPGGSAAKVLMFVAGGVFLLGAVGVTGAVYVAYRAKQKITQLKSEYLPTRDSESSRPVAAMKPPAGGGCPILSWQEASEVLGIAWERVSYSPGSDNGGACDFSTTPAERQHFGERQLAAGLSGMSDAKNNQDEQKEVQRMFAGLVNTLANAQVPAGDKDANDGIRIQFVREHGAQAWTKFDQLQAGAKVVSSVSGSQIGMTPIEGLGDKAYVLPAGVGVMVLKGDAFFGMTFFAWPGQDKAAALAKRVAKHL